MHLAWSPDLGQSFTSAMSCIGRISKNLALKLIDVRFDLRLHCASTGTLPALPSTLGPGRLFDCLCHLMLKGSPSAVSFAVRYNELGSSCSVAGEMVVLAGLLDNIPPFEISPSTMKKSNQATAFLQRTHPSMYEANPHAEC